MHLKEWTGMERWALAACITAMLTACGGQGGSSQVAATPASAVLAAATVITAPPQSYTAININHDFKIETATHALNDDGQVCGAYPFPPNGYDTAALYADGSLRNLHPPGYAGTSFATAINAKGQVTGRLSVDSTTNSALFYDGSSSQNLGKFGNSTALPTLVNNNGTIAGTVAVFLSTGSAQTTFQSTGIGAAYPTVPLSPFRSSPRDMNDTGQIVGNYMSSTGSITGKTNAFLSTDGVARDIGGLSGTIDSDAYAINASGSITGTSFNGTAKHAFRYENGVMSDLGVLDPAADASSGLAINASGQIAGNSGTDDTNTHAFFHDGAGMKDLGTLGGRYSYVTAMNAHGHVVGKFEKAGGEHGFIWSPSDGTMVDLNTRITNAPGIEILSAEAISDSGYILARANTGGWVLLKPGAASVAPPTVGPIAANGPVALGSAVTASVQFTDADNADTHTASWNWGDGSTTSSTVTEPNGATPGSVSANHVFTTTGVYNITVTVTDSAGKGSSVGSQVVVYDPNGGFVAGGGWITSPPGAYKADPTMSGRANFGFTSKYLKGATKPSGQTEFQFQSANLNFHSTDYDWLVVGGARAQYKGTGTINGSGSYKFLLTAVDGDLIGRGTPDRFRMRIWHYDDTAKADVVDYDNQLDSGTEGGNLEGTAIGGGSINIKTK